MAVGPGEPGVGAGLPGPALGASEGVSVLAEVIVQMTRIDPKPFSRDPLSSQPSPGDKMPPHPSPFLQLFSNHRA